MPTRLESPSTNGKRPAWDRDRGILSLAGVVVKRFDKPAENQRRILHAFQAANWVAWIANPLKPDYEKDDRQRLADAVYKLNRNQRKHLIRFRRDGQGLGITWELVETKKPRKKR